MYQYDGDWGDISDWKQLSYVDESADYEVDQFAICLDEKQNKFIFARASGCSCWSGETTFYVFDTWDELVDNLVNRTEMVYAPGLETCNAMIAEVAAALKTDVKPLFLC